VLDYALNHRQTTVNEQLTSCHQQLPTAHNCPQFSSDRLWICVIFGRRKLLEIGV